ncbi:MAG: VanZ family protein [Nitrospira sp.]|jgi:VanZ family protein
MLTFLRYWGPVCAYAGVIFYLSSLSHPEEHLPIVSRFSDKVLHAVEYAVFGALCFWALQGTLNVSWRRWAIPLAIVLASLYGVTDEFHQSFVPFRYSHVLDWVADTIGAILGVLAMHRAVNFSPANSIPEVGQ